VVRAENWLRATLPQTNEDRAFRLLGLAWAAAPKIDIEKAASLLLAGQRSDGGWAQLPTRSSDAYATGLALMALRLGAEISDKHAGYQRGLRFLLNTQLPDGSWLVETRRHPPTPGNFYVDSGFPHGESQFISCAGSNWAAMALLSLLPKSRQVESLGPAKSSLPSWAETALFGSPAELHALLDGGLDQNTATAAGTTLLMMASANSEKIRLLIERGASVNSKAASGATALIVASRVNGNLDGFRLLVASGADLHAVTNNGITTLGAAIVSEPEKVALLISKGVEINDKFNYAGWTALYPLQLAVTAGNTEVVRLLVNKGADINRHASVDFGALPPLSRAVSNGQAAMVKLLLSLGADANYVDPLGMTPLLWAASSDYGHGEIVKALLAAGANPNARDKDGSASSALAKKYKIDGVIPLLTKKPARAPL